MTAPDIAAVEVVTAEPPVSGARVLAPLGIASALGSVAGMTVEGGCIAETLCEVETGQPAALIAPESAAPVRLTYRFAQPGSAPRYPESAFRHRPNRHTTAADALIEVSRRIAAEAGGGRDAIFALVGEARARFTYDHPDEAFNQGLADVPYLGCGVAAGSCIDINIYLIASLRAAGFEAAYAYGYFFPAEKKTWTVDLHCWVATRHGGEVLEWDIAHHMKAGLDPVRPALNPKPGRRVILGHSMGHLYLSSAGPIERKLLAEPVWVLPDGTVSWPPQESIRIV
jgi:transglutaminase-like putative cysteine protease